MNSYDFASLVLGLLLSLFIFTSVIFNYRKFKTLTSYQIASLFYWFIFSMVPMYFIFAEKPPLIKMSGSEYASNAYLLVAWSFLGYFFLMGSYKIGLKVRLRTKVKSTKVFPVRKYTYWAVLSLCIGMLGVWIEIYLNGGFINSIINIELLRSFGIDSAIQDGRNNPLVFLRMLKPFILISFYIFYMLARYNGDFRYRTMTFLTFVLSFYVVFIGGGRLHVVVFLATVFVGFMTSTKRKRYLQSMSAAKKVFTLFVIASIGVISLNLLDPLFAYLTFGRPIQVEAFKVDGLFSEFSFPLANSLFLFTNDVSYRFFQDLFIWVLSIFPSFVTSRLGLSEFAPLYEYNTLQQLGTMQFGGLPSDIFTLGFYQLGFIGAMIVMMLFGFILSRLDKLVFELKDYTFLKPIVLRVIIYIGMIVMYADLEGIFRGRFDVIFLIYLLYDVKKYSNHINASLSNEQNKVA